MAKCMMCKKAPGTHFLCCKTVCQACYDVLAGTPEGVKEIAKRASVREAQAAKTAAEAARQADLTDEERDRESAAIKRQNANQGKYVPYDDPARIRRAD
ncbi:MAG: hypothetical protein M0Q43_11590 [Methanothrix sp.]|nr:hypothetical protein [Methanothrix sp.]